MALLGMCLTVKQARIWALRGEGKRAREIAVAVGVSLSVVRKQLWAVRQKLGIARGAKSALKGRPPTEATDPEKAAAVLDGASEPEGLKKVAVAMREAGLPEAVQAALLRRLRIRYFGVVSEVRNLKTQELLDLLGRKLHLALSYMDDKVIAEASFRDLALGSTAMIEKRQLLRGEPTQIVSDLERKRLAELTPLLIAEALRRGITYDGAVVAKVVEPA